MGRYGSALCYCPFTWLYKCTVGVLILWFFNPFGVRRLSAIRLQDERFVLGPAEVTKLKSWMQIILLPFTHGVHP
jgi:hypothetical protein